MVSTRSGRVVSSSDAPVGRVTRSRARSKADTLAEESAADLGQPEVTSPALPVTTPVEGFAGSPAAFGGLGSPLTMQRKNETPMQNDIFGTPLQERIVKTVGKAPPQTPLGRPAAAATPGRSAQEVFQVANLPLPDDVGSEETEPFASSEDERVPSAYHGQTQGREPTQEAFSACSRRGSGGLLALFALSSILVTAVIAMLLGPCTDPELYVLVQSPAYERVCKKMAHLQIDASRRAEDLAWRMRAEVADLAAAVHAKLPPATQEALGQAWEPMQQAHKAAWSALQHASEQAKPHLELLQQQVHDVYKHVSSLVFTHVAPLLRDTLSRVAERFPTPDAAATSGASTQDSPVAQPPEGDGITSLGLGDFLAMLDQAEQVQQYAQALWDAAAEQMARKHKAVAWVLACRHAGECSATDGALYHSAVSILRIDGASFSAQDSSGALQSDLVQFLRAYPSGLVVVIQPERLHPSSVSVLNAAMSEGGHLQMDGAPVTTKKALYVFIVQDPAASVYDADGVKDRLCDLISAVEPEAASTPAITLSFRRRLDAVLPVLQRPVESS